jgi:hypothetical protein
MTIRKDQVHGALHLSKCLPDYQPLAHTRSEILTEGQIHVLTYHLPGTVRLQNWQLLYTIDRDGYSYVTFFDKI